MFKANGVRYNEGGKKSNLLINNVNKTAKKHIFALVLVHILMLICVNEPAMSFFDVFPYICDALSTTY